MPCPLPCPEPEPTPTSPDQPASLAVYREVDRAEIIVPRFLNRPFTYAVPAHLRDRLRVGSLVKVPFGKTILRGLVVALSAHETDPAGPSGFPAGRLREILSLAEATDTQPVADLTPDLLALIGQVSAQYLTPWGQCLRLALPNSPSKKPKRGPNSGLGGEADPRLIPAYPTKPFRAGEEQPAWLDRVRTGLDQGGSAILLCAASDPDRWERLLLAAGDALARKRRVLILAPEIARVSAIARPAALLWGDRVAVFHSGLPAATRAEVWQKIRTGAHDLVVGTRSAIFAPLDGIGLIWVEGEEDPAFKEEQAPRYHAREVARIRARCHQAVLVLASPHPSVETLRAGDVEIVPAREGEGDPRRMVGGLQHPPSMLLADLRHSPYGTVLSEAMLTGIETAIRAGTGAVLFLNRKGFAPSLLCRECGQAPQCGRCNVALTFYRRIGRLACTYCGASRPLSDTCPSCLAPRLEPVGYGTERLEEDLRRLFPEARIGRLDGDTARSPARGEAIRLQAASGRFDILIGTQMLFQGAPLPPVGFVGLPHADAGLHLPDFRAAERTYHGLLDAVALAHSAERGGKVVLQTFLPAHHVIEAVFRNDPGVFFDQEMRFRRDLGYPPFSHLVRLGVSSTNADSGKREADHWGKLLDRIVREGQKSLQGTGRDRDMVVLGPVPAPVAKLRGRYRWQLLVKARDAETARRVVEASLADLEHRKGTSRVKFEVDVDPVEMF